MPALSFKPVTKQKRRAKVLLIGDPGVGKTHAALTFPKCAVIDAEGSIDWFADRVPDMSAVATKSYADVRDLIASIRAGNVTCETLVIDSLTSIYNSLVNAATVERAKSGNDDLRPLDWGRIKRKFSSLLDELYYKLNVNVVCVGWIKAEYARAGTRVDGEVVKKNDLVQIGEQFDGDKKTAYAFDFVIKILGNDGKKTRAQIIKTRSGELKTGQVIEDFSYKTIEKLFGSGTAVGMTDEEAEARDAGTLDKPEPKKRDDERRWYTSARIRLADLVKERGISRVTYDELMVELFGMERFRDLEGRPGIQPTTKVLTEGEFSKYFTILEQRSRVHATA